jgi:hypothetical protein
MKTFTQDEAIAYLQKKQGKRTRKEFAEVLGVSPQYLDGIYRKAFLPGKRVGFKQEKVRHYVLLENFNGRS